MHDISPNERSNIFEIIMISVSVCKAALLNSDVSLMPQVREPIWNPARFFYKKNFCKKMSFKNSKTLRKC